MISILLPVHGASPFLKNTLDSIGPQLKQGTELVVILDRADPAVITLIENWSSDFVGVKVLSSPKPGISSALNFGLRASHGDLIARIDADDILVESRLELQRVFLGQHPDYVAVGTQLRFIDAVGSTKGLSRLPLFSWQIELELCLWNPLAHPTMMYRKMDLMECGGYNEEVEYAQDFELARRLKKRGRIANLSQVGVLYRQHPGQVSSTKIAKRTNIIARLLHENNEVQLNVHDATKLARWTAESNAPSKFLAALVLFTLRHPLLGLALTASKVVTAITSVTGFDLRPNRVRD